MSLDKENELRDVEVDVVPVEHIPSPNVSLTSQAVIGEECLVVEQSESRSEDESPEGNTDQRIMTDEERFVCDIMFKHISKVGVEERYIRPQKEESNVAKANSTSKPLTLTQELFQASGVGIQTRDEITHRSNTTNYNRASISDGRSPYPWSGERTQGYQRRGPWTGERTARGPEQGPWTGERTARGQQRGPWTGERTTRGQQQGQCGSEIDSKNSQCGKEKRGQRSRGGGRGGVFRVQDCSLDDKEVLGKEDACDNAQSSSLAT